MNTSTSTISKNKIQHELIEMVMRQTTYTYEESKYHLENNNNNYIKVIKEALGISNDKKEKPITSINQHIYKEIRELMDSASNNYRINQEIEKKRQMAIMRLKKELEEKKNNENKSKGQLESVNEEQEDNQEKLALEQNEEVKLDNTVTND
mgnify:CR=1 FL=1|tara:strand:+ start:146 stop:598 length:453 start_codon:yes stop_codon:yes gene_type:complete